MSYKMPNTPFSTCLSGSAKETELRLRSIFQWKKKRPPMMLIILVAVILLLCFGLFSCVAEEPQPEDPAVHENPNLEEVQKQDIPSEQINGDNQAEKYPSAAEIKRLRAERYQNAIRSYDTNGDGVLQTLEFPHPDPELFGLTGADAALFSAVSEYIRQTLYIDPEDTMLLLSSVTVYGEYNGENGATHYVCGLWRGMDYDAGTHLAEGGAKFGSNWGGGGYLARVTLSADGSLLEVLPTLEGANNTARIYEICGPLTELAEEALRGSGAEGRSLAPRDVSIFTRYLGYYFPSTMAVQENIKDFLRHHMEEYSILVLDVNEVTGMVDICLGDYRPEIVAEIKQLVEANYSCSDCLNFEDYTGMVVLTT